MSDLEFLKDPDGWPIWPYLPLKRVTKDNRREHGYIKAHDLTVVFVGNAFTPSMKDRRILYDSAEAILKDGWIID